jgi:hypothetical protein
MTTITDKTNSLRRFLVRATLLGAVVTVGFVGMLTMDRIGRQLPLSTCAECSLGAGDDMAAILRE